MGRVILDDPTQEFDRLGDGLEVLVHHGGQPQRRGVRRFDLGHLRHRLDVVAAPQQVVGRPAKGLHVVVGVEVDLDDFTIDFDNIADLPPAALPPVLRIGVVGPAFPLLDQLEEGLDQLGLLAGLLVKISSLAERGQGLAGVPAFLVHLAEIHVHLGIALGLGILLQDGVPPLDRIAVAVELGEAVALEHLDGKNPLAGGIPLEVFVG